jgi:hypothetical protein
VLKGEDLFGDQSLSAIIVSGNNLGALCNLARAGFGLDGAGQHISARSLARVTHESISLHGPNDRMGRDCDMHHDRSALGTMRGVVDCVARRHGL